MNRRNFAVLIACAAIGFMVASSSVAWAGQTAPGTVNVPTGEVDLGSVELPTAGP